MLFLFVTVQINGNAQKHAPKTYLKTIRNGIYPEGSARLIRYYDIEGLTSWDLKIMRNEIFARKGYIFKTKDMIDYFNQTTWYIPRFNDVTKLLSEIEKINCEFIKLHE